MSTPLPPLTEKEKAVLEFIEGNLTEKGVSPSFEEIRTHFGLASYNSVQNYLKQLSHKGYVQTSPHQNRAIQVLHTAHSVQHRMQSQVIAVPLLGKVAAGSPLEAFTYDETVDVPPSLVKNKKSTFALRVAGTSMIEDGILDGDIILVQKQPTAHNGEIVVATIENEATVKRFYLRAKANEGNDKMVELKPANSTMKSLWYPSHKVHIEGIVVGLIRKFM